MKRLKSILLKLVEILSYVLLVGFIFRYLNSSRREIPLKLEDDLASVDETSQNDLADSQEEFDDEVEQLGEEEQRIFDLDGNALTSEFDREFGGVQVVKADGSD